MRQSLAAVTATAVLTAGSAWAQARPAPRIEDPRSAFGAFAAPAALPPGSTAAYGFAGVPEIGAGFRQGLDGLELDTRLKFEWVSLALSLEALGKFPAWTSGPFQLAPV